MRLTLFGLFQAAFFTFVSFVSPTIAKADLKIFIQRSFKTYHTARLADGTELSFGYIDTGAASVAAFNALKLELSKIPSLAQLDLNAYSHLTDQKLTFRVHEIVSTNLKFTTDYNTGFSDTHYFLISWTKNIATGEWIEQFKIQVPESLDPPSPVFFEDVRTFLTLEKAPVEYVATQVELLKAQLVEAMSENSLKDEPGSRQKDALMLEVVKNLTALEPRIKRIRSRRSKFFRSNKKTTLLEGKLALDFSETKADLLNVAAAAGLNEAAIKRQLNKANAHDAFMLSGADEPSAIMLKKHGEALQAALAHDVSELVLEGDLKVELKFHPAKVIAPVTTVRKIGISSFDVEIKILNGETVVAEKTKTITFTTTGNQDPSFDLNFESWREELQEMIREISEKAVPALPGEVLNKLSVSKQFESKTQKLLSSGENLEEKAKRLYCQGLATKK